MYYHLVYEEYIKDKPDAKDWTIVITFIVVDKYNQIYPFQVSQESLAAWLKDFDKIIDIVKYHYENKDFTLPYELAIGNVKL
jgi:nicotinamide riboside transporter PnuC